jgi:hypothetical protein
VPPPFPRSSISVRNFFLQKPRYVDRHFPSFPSSTVLSFLVFLYESAAKQEHYFEMDLHCLTDSLPESERSFSFRLFPPVLRSNAENSLSSFLKFSSQEIHVIMASIRSYSKIVVTRFLESGANIPGCFGMLESSSACSYSLVLGMVECLFLCISSDCGDKILRVWC